MPFVWVQTLFIGAVNQLRMQTGNAGGCMSPTCTIVCRYLTGLVVIYYRYSWGEYIHLCKSMYDGSKKGTFSQKIKILSSFTHPIKSDWTCMIIFHGTQTKFIAECPSCCKNKNLLTKPRDILVGIVNWLRSVNTVFAGFSCPWASKWHAGHG